MIADINDEARVAELLGDSIYDAVCDFIVFTPDQAARDVRLVPRSCPAVCVYQLGFRLLQAPAAPAYRRGYATG